MIDFSDSQLDCDFTDSDRKSCLPLIDRIDKYAIIASKKGLLALDDIAKKESNKFLKIALELMMDVARADTIAEILLTTIIADKPSGADLLGKLIIVHGAMYLTESEDYSVATEKPLLIKKRLYALCMGIGRENPVEL
jgi:hypothetical protein